MTLPTLIVAIFLAAVLQPGRWNIVVILALVFWSQYARISQGRAMAMILQEPMASLNPLCTTFNQIAGPAYFHRQLRRLRLRGPIASLLHMVRIPSPDTRMHEYPHQMSGGT